MRINLREELAAELHPASTWNDWALGIFKNKMSNDTSSVPDLKRSKMKTDEHEIFLS